MTIVETVSKILHERVNCLENHQNKIKKNTNPMQCFILEYKSWIAKTLQLSDDWQIVTAKRVLKWKEALSLFHKKFFSHFKGKIKL